MPVICCRKKSIVPMVICFRFAGASSSATDASFSPLSSPAVASAAASGAPHSAVSAVSASATLPRRRSHTGLSGTTDMKKNCEAAGATA